MWLQEKKMCSGQHLAINKRYTPMNMKNWLSILNHVQVHENVVGYSQMLNMSHLRNSLSQMSRNCYSNLPHMWIMYSIWNFGWRPIAKYRSTNNVFDGKWTPEKEGNKNKMSDIQDHIPKTKKGHQLRLCKVDKVCCKFFFYSLSNTFPNSGNEI